VTIKQTAAAVRTRARSLALAALLGIAASGAIVPSVHALETSGSGGGGAKVCHIPGSDFPYLPGDKATFSLNGQPAALHTCKSDGEWTAIRLPDTWGQVNWGSTYTYTYAP
jgi:hypothetical protein